MHINDIQKRLNKLNAAAPAVKKIKKVAAAPAVKTNGHTVLTADEQLAFAAGRIIAALNLAAKGVTVEALVAGVKKFETPYTGVKQ